MKNRLQQLREAYPQGPLAAFTRRAMASEFEACFNDVEDADAEANAAAAALDAFDEIDRIENVLSIFRAASAISRINALAAEMDVRVDDELWNWLETALRFSAETDGAFDPAAAPLWRAWGFAKRDGEFPAPDALARALELSGARHVRLNADARTVAFDRQGVELNFGAIGKGIALDAAARIMEARGETDFLLQGGKSGVVARGGRVNDFSPSSLATALGVDSISGSEYEEEEDSEIDEESGFARRAARPSRALSDAVELLTPSVFQGSDAPFRAPSGELGWTIGVAHPFAPTRRIGEIWLKDRALATSGSTHQFFRSGGKRYSHVIDPRTGRPADAAASTTVAAPTATEADALSTAFFVLGVEKSREYCARHPEIGALFTVESEKSPGFELVAINLSSDEWRRCES